MKQRIRDVIPGIGKEGTPTKAAKIYGINITMDSNIEPTREACNITFLRNIFVAGPDLISEMTDDIFFKFFEISPGLRISKV